MQDDDPNSETVAIDHAAQGGGYVGVSAPLTATVADDDVGVIVDTDADMSGDQQTPLALTEGQTRTYRVRLSTLPAGGSVTVAVASDNDAIDVAPGASGGSFGSAANLTFTTENWATAQTVRVQAEEDADAVGERGTISNDPSGAQYGDAATIHIAATAQDDEMRGTDYDADDDGLIEIATLERLDAVRWDLDGDGSPLSSTSTYLGAFAGSVLAEDMGCLDGPDPDQKGDCAGYELMADLDFDTDGDGGTWTETGGTVAGDGEDAHYNGGAGWDPIGGTTSSTRYRATFHGNGHVVENLFVNRPTEDYAGLFGQVAAGGRIEALGLADAYVRADDSAGILAGWLAGEAAGCYSTGRVVGGNAVDSGDLGGLVGSLASSGSIAACYSAAAVSGVRNVGGLVGSVSEAGAATIDNSYAAGPVSGAGGGLVGWVHGSNTASTTASYYDSVATGAATSVRGTSQSTRALQTPTSATGTCTRRGTTTTPTATARWTRPTTPGTSAPRTTIRR